MNASLAVRPNTGIHALDFMEPGELISAMESLLYPGAKHDSIKLVIANCRAQVLDPMTKPFHITPMRVKQRKRDAQGQETNKTEYVWRDVVMPGIELYRIKAARTNEYAGMDEALWGPAIKMSLGGEDKTEWDDDARAKVKKGTWPKLEIEVPEWCEFVVYRIVQGTRYPFRSGRVYWEETYATAGNETSLPNEMWKKRKRGQLEKCAEALALRRAFPEIGAAPIREEMEGKVIDASNIVDGTVTEKTIYRTGPQTTDSSASSGTAEGNPAEASTTTDNGGKQAELISEGAKRTLRGAMARAGRTEADLVAANFPKLDEMRFDRFNEAMDWMKKNPAAK